MSEKNGIEIIHKNMLNRIFETLPQMFGTILQDLESQFSPRFTEELKRSVRPIVLGGYAYMKHIDTFWNWYDKDGITPERVTPLFTDDIDIKLTIVPSVDDINSNTDKSLLYSLKLFRVLLLHNVIKTVNSYYSALYGTNLKYKIKICGIYGDDIKAVVSSLMNTMNAIELVALTITYTGSISEYDMGLIDTTFYIREVETCDPMALSIKQFCSNKAYLNYMDTTDPDSFLKKKFQIMLNTLAKLKRKIDMFYKQKISSSEIDSVIQVLQNMSHEIHSFAQQPNSGNIYIQVKQKLDDLLLFLKSSNRTKDEYYNAIEGFKKSIIDFEFNQSSQKTNGKIILDPKEIISPIIDIRTNPIYTKTNITDIDINSYDYLTGYEYLIIDTARMLLQINMFDTTNGNTIQSHWANVYKFHKYAIKFLHICFVYMRIYLGINENTDPNTLQMYMKISKQIKSKIDQLENNITVRYQEIIDQGKRLDVTENYEFWKQIAIYLWNILDEFESNPISPILHETIHDHLEIANTMLPIDMMKTSVFYGGSLNEHTSGQQYLYSTFNNIYIPKRYDSFLDYPEISNYRIKTSVKAYQKTIR